MLLLLLFDIVKSYSIQSTDSLDITPNIQFITQLDSSFITKYEIIYMTDKQFKYIESTLIKTEILEHIDIFVYILIFIYIYRIMNQLSLHQQKISYSIQKQSLQSQTYINLIITYYISIISYLYHQFKVKLH